jgi:hypothetical protein
VIEILLRGLLEHLAARCDVFRQGRIDHVGISGTSALAK